MSYAIITENDKSVYWGLDALECEWHFSSVQEAEEQIERWEEDNAGSGATQIYHIVYVEKTLTVHSPKTEQIVSSSQ